MLPAPTSQTKRQYLTLGFISLLALFCTACAGFSQAQPETPAEAVVIPRNRVVALGRLVPKGNVIKLSVPNAADSRVNQLLVAEGDTVEANQIIAILQGFDRRQRDLEEAQKTVELFQARLDQLRSGDAKQAEIAAQQANIDRLIARQRNEIVEREAAIASAEAELRQAQLVHQRNVELAQAGAISLADQDLSQEALDRAQANLKQRQAQLSDSQQTLSEQIEQEQENLATLQEVRPVDLQVAQTELERAQIAVEQRRADLEDTRVRVPIAGQILRINTQVGEQVNTQEGIVELGQTDQMYAIAEVYETEITRVKAGQPATLSSEYGGFAEEIQGIVDHIGLQVGQRSLATASNDPTNDENTRIVEVKIRIDPDDSPKVAGLTNLQVRVEIDTNASDLKISN